MNRKTVINIVLVCLLVAYIFIMVPMTNRAERNDTFKTVQININDESNIGFLTEKDVYKILYQQYSGFDTLRRKNINTYDITQLLNANNRVENSDCLILSDGTLIINIEPLSPVARIFDREGSVYVNASGKRVPSHPSYHVDVPVVTTNSVADSVMMKKLLPILSAIKSDSQINALVSSLRIDGRGDIIIIPNVVGHVINFGDSTLISNKFARLRTFYREVMPARGWDAYDTISVKWDGRIVATKRDKTIPSRINAADLDSVIEDIPDAEVMMVDASNG